MNHARSILTACLCTLTGCALLSTAPAQARIVHVFEKSFGSEGTGPGQFKKPVGVAVNDVTHNVYVADSANNRVQEFNSTGAYIGEFNGSGSPTGVFSEPTQIAVDNSGNPLDPSAGDVYVVDYRHNVIDKFSESGAYIGQLTGTTCEHPTELEKPTACPKSGTVHPFEELGGVAVDPNGTLWTIEHFKGYIDNFSDGQTNEPLSTRSTTFGGFLRAGLAVDAEDDIYMNVEWIAKVNSNGVALINPFCGSFTEGASGVALDLTLGQAFVDKFTSIAACGLAGEPVESFGSGHLTSSRGVAADASSGEPSSGTVYASDFPAARVAIFTAVTLPTVSVVEPSEQQPRSVTLKGTVNPEGRPVTSCVFEYDTTPYTTAVSHGTSVPCSPASVGSGSAPVAVSAHITGLTPETEYHYRLVASNAGGSSETADQKLFMGPILGGEYATSVTADSATLNVPLDPNGDDTHYYFEYGTTMSYGTFAPVAPPGADAGSLRGAQTISAHVQGLQARTVYHYRLVVEQAGEVFEEPDRTFTTQPLAGGGAGNLALPDGRAWELVSPADKKGALIEFLPGFADDIQAASDGSGIYYRTLSQLGEEPVGKGVASYVLSSHSSVGWRSRDLTLHDVPPPEGDQPDDLVGGLEYVLFSPNLSLALVEPHRNSPPLSSPPMAERTLYLGNLAGGGFTPLVTPENTPPETKIGTESPEPIRVYGSTPDLSHVVLHSPVALTAGANDEYYEWSGGQLQPVAILPDGKPFVGAGSVFPNLAGKGDEFGSAQRAMSNDGRWVGWTAGNPYNNSSSSVPLYVRDMVEERTVQVGGPHARYQTMSSDGSKVFYLEEGDLYLFETANDTQTDLTANHGAGETSAGVLEAVSDVSEDGSYAYFVARGVLASGAVAGQPNLYLLHDEAGVWSAPVLIATLSSEDQKDWHAWAFATGTSSTALSQVASRVSPDGRFLAFMSERSPTGYDNRDAVSGRPDEEVFVYDALAGRLVCASCNPTGARPNGIADKTNGEPLVDRGGIWSGRGGEQHEHWLAGSIPGWDEGDHRRSMYQPHYLSNSGRLFFDSPDALVPQATNGLEDVYEYEPPGVGDCTSASVTFSERSMGCVNLVSSGISSSESAFFDANENGDDVFFITAAKLLGEDYDTAYDVYDAHACSASAPCRTEPVSPPPCSSGDSCKPAPSLQPEIFGPAPSATFSGRGNVLPPSVGAVRPRSLTRAQKLARALRACRSKPRRKRIACERQARRRYRAKRSGNVMASGKGGR